MEEIVVPGFDVFNPRVLQAIQEAVFAFCDATNRTALTDVATAQEQLRKELAAGLEAGESLAKLTARVGGIFRDPAKALTIAASESSRALHGGMVLAAQESGVCRGIRWLASSDACDRCLKLDGQERNFGEAFHVEAKGGPYARCEHPPLHPHCFLPETPVLALNTRAAVRAFYSGPILRLRFSDGSNISCTPNHLYLTPNGFALAASLVQGDQVIHCPVLQRILAAQPDDDRYPALIEKVFGTLQELPEARRSKVTSLPEDLHGDAAFCQPEIDVVGAYGFLQNNLNARSLQTVPEVDFTDAGAASANHALFALRNLATVLESLFLATGGTMGSFRDAKAIFLASLRHAQRSRFGKRSQFDALLQEIFFDHIHMDVEIGRNLLETVSSTVAGRDFRPQMDTAQCGPLSVATSGKTGIPQSLPEGVSGHANRASDAFDMLTSLLAPIDFYEINRHHAQRSQSNPVRYQSESDGVRSDAARLGKCLQCFAGQVATCQVVNVKLDHYRGPVYDLETDSTMYIVGNGVVVSNCMCSATEVLIGSEEAKTYRRAA